MDKPKTVKALAHTTGALWISENNYRPFKDGDSLDWPADDAARAEASGIITVQSPAAKPKQ